MPRSNNSSIYRDMGQVELSQWGVTNYEQLKKREMALTFFTVFELPFKKNKIVTYWQLNSVSCKLSSNNYGILDTKVTS